MKKFTLTTIAMLMAGTACVANASDKIGAYATVQGNLGLGSISTLKNSETGAKVSSDLYKSRFNYAFGVAAGYSFNELLNLPIRAELEYSYARNTDFMKEKTSGVSNTSHLVMANAYYDFSGLVPAMDDLGLTPYVGAGIGYAYNNINYKTDAGKKHSVGGSTYAFNLGFGVNYKIMDDLSVNAGYRFIHTGAAKIKSTEQGEEYSVKLSKNFNHFNFGVTYSF